MSLWGCLWTQSKTSSRDPGLLEGCTCKVVEDPKTAMPVEYYKNDQLNRNAHNPACEAKFERLRETQ